MATSMAVRLMDSWSCFKLCRLLKAVTHIFSGSPLTCKNEVGMLSKTARHFSLREDHSSSAKLLLDLCCKIQ